MNAFTSICRFSVLALLALAVVGCSSVGSEPEDARSFPVDNERMREQRHGKITGEGGLRLFGGSDDDDSGGASPIGVNSFLWRATLDTLTFMPITSADPFGGVILTDWHEDPKVQGERFKITALILDRSLRTDSIKVTVHKQTRDEHGEWRGDSVNADLARQLEDTILTQARELRVRSGG